MSHAYAAWLAAHQDGHELTAAADAVLEGEDRAIEGVAENLYFYAFDLESAADNRVEDRAEHLLGQKRRGDGTGKGDGDWSGEGTGLGERYMADNGDDRSQPRGPGSVWNDNRMPKVWRPSQE